MPTLCVEPEEALKVNYVEATSRYLFVGVMTEEHGEEAHDAAEKVAEEEIGWGSMQGGDQQTWGYEFRFERYLPH